MRLGLEAADWGSVPDWIGGVGTALSLIAVTVGLIWEIHRRRIDDEKIADERADSQRAQARLIHLKLEPLDDYRVTFIVSNDSNAPIFDLELHMSSTQGPPVQVLSFVPGVPERLDAADTISISVSGHVPDGTASGALLRDVLGIHAETLRGMRHVGDNRYQASWEREGAGVALLRLECWLTFVDADGRFWRVEYGNRTPERLFEPGAHEWMREP